jgi:hypothetical protein
MSKRNLSFETEGVSIYNVLNENKALFTHVNQIATPD